MDVPSKESWLGRTQKFGVRIQERRTLPERYCHGNRTIFLTRNECVRGDFAFLTDRKWGLSLFHGGNVRTWNMDGARFQCFPRVTALRINSPDQIVLSGSRLYGPEHTVNTRC